MAINTVKQVTETQAYEALRLAQCNEHRGQLASSAKLCADDAASLFNAGMFVDSFRRSVESLRYSVGVFGEAYNKAQALLCICIGERNKGCSAHP